MQKVKSPGEEDDYRSKTLETIVSNLDNPYKHILEFGVFKGFTMNSIIKNLKNPQNYKLFGFDSFFGLPEDWDGTILRKGFFNLDGDIPEDLLKIENLKIFKGLFKDTIPEYLKISENIAILHIDSDLYSSAIDILYSDIRFFIKPGSYIVFDQWFYNRKNIVENRQHEQKAFYEWVNDFNIKFELLDKIDDPFTPMGMEKQAIKIL